MDTSFDLGYIKKTPKLSKRHRNSQLHGTKLYWRANKKKICLSMYKHMINFLSVSSCAQFRAAILLNFGINEIKYLPWVNLYHISSHSDAVLRTTDLFAWKKHYHKYRENIKFHFVFTSSIQQNSNLCWKIFQTLFFKDLRNSPNFKP